MRQASEAARERSVAESAISLHKCSGSAAKSGPLCRSGTALALSEKKDSGDVLT